MRRYKDMDEAESGDIVECLVPFDDRYTIGNLYVVKRLYPHSIQVMRCDDGFTEDSWGKEKFKLVVTKDGEEAKNGDEVIVIRRTGSLKVGDTFQCTYHNEKDYLGINVDKPHHLQDKHYTPHNSNNWYKDAFKVTSHAKILDLSEVFKT